MRVLITGGAGCLGSNLARHWLSQGHDICILDAFVTGSREAVPENTGALVVEGSVADADCIRNCFTTFRPTHVLHAAASYDEPENWWRDIETNISGTVHVVREAEKNGAQRLIYLQTALCYGRPGTIPVPVEHPLAPFTSYGISKTAGEQYALMSSVPTISLRIANVAGPRMAIGPIPAFYKRLKAGQKVFCSDAVRDFLDIDDFIAFMDSAVALTAPVGIFNVASGEGHSIKEVLCLVAEHLNVSLPEIPLLPCGPDDVSVMVLDPAKTEQAFGWKAKYTFHDTVKRMLSWYDHHGVTAQNSHLIGHKEA